MQRVSESLVHEAPLSAAAIRIWAPLVRQPDAYTCGVAALQSVLHYFGHAVRHDQLSAALGADPVHGTNYQRIAAYARASGLVVEIATGMEVVQLRRLLDEGAPVIVALQAWGATAAGAYEDEWEEGHYVVVVGYDALYFYFMDPSTLGNYTYLPVHDFLARWHDYYLEAGERIELRRFAMAFRGAATTYARDRVLPLG